MNSEEIINDTTVTMEEKIGQGVDDTKVPEHEAIKKEISNWTEIKGISDKSDDLNNVKTEKNGTSVKDENQDTEKNTAEKKTDGGGENKNETESKDNNEIKPLCIEDEDSEVTVEQKVEKKLPGSLENKVVAKIEKINVIHDDKAEGKCDGKVEETETIQLIEETIIIPEVAGQTTKTEETIEYNVIEYTETTAISDSSSPAVKKLPVSGTNLQKLVEIKKRSLIDDIFDDWRDENPEDEEKDSSAKLDDAVEDQLKSLLDEKTSSKSPEPKYQRSLSPIKPPRNNDTNKVVSNTPESAKPLLNNDKESSKTVEIINEENKVAKRHDDSKELLAILEGDVEPDWSNLKPTVESSKVGGGADNSKSTESKLDPLVERQLALKQLLELPMTTSDTPKSSTRKPTTVEQVKPEETRSGRKRKPTEKAREHEIIAKRQKILKSKPAPQPKKAILPLNNESSELEKNKQVSLNDSSKELDISEKLLPTPKGTKEKKAVGKKMVRKALPKVSPMKKTAKGSAAAAAAATTADGTPKPRKKAVNEIDRLLQDEGVVNLLYDVEQPGKRRLVPVTKSQVKVMDIQKVQRELKIRTKLVKNAVLRLRTSTTPGPKAPRAKRISTSLIEQEQAQTAAATQESANKSSKSSEFLFPARIRNAADASIIVRRHSSSSFSSASGSPRVSFDSTERQYNLDEGKNTNYPAKINKRTISQEDKKQKGAESKKIKRPSDSKLNESVLPKNKGRLSSAGVKGMKNNEETSPVKSNGTSSKIVKPKKNLNKNSKVTFAKTTGLNDNDSQNDDQEIDEDELSVCLAEAVTALANDSSNRAKNSLLNRKTKYRGKDPTKAQFTNKEINVQRHGNLVQLIITPSTSSKIRNAITLPMMQEFKDVLSVLKKDDNCRVVLLTSTGSSFCEGLELSTLLEEDQDTRRANAQLLANGVKDFIKSLATFNKPIVAGVQGSAVGLGVTMLPLFDLVIASDKASFSTPYGKLGQIAEGAAVFTLSHVLGSAVTSELLLGGRTLTANEALRAGLVTRVLWPDRFHVELLPSLRAMSEQSSQSMEATKALLRHSLRTKLAAALESESYLLVQHWCSNECQNAIRAYMDEKIQ